MSEYEFKGTPGPWYHGNPNVPNPKKNAVWAVEQRCVDGSGNSLPGLQCIAHCNFTGEMVPGIDDANAALIAAAPELFEALKWAERALAPFSTEPAEKSGMAMIRKALAHAVGEG